MHAKSLHHTTVRLQSSVGRLRSQTVVPVVDLHLSKVDLFQFAHTMPRSSTCVRSRKEISLSVACVARRTAEMSKNEQRRAALLVVAS
jgi:hypothetical protein